MTSRYHPEMTPAQLVLAWFPDASESEAEALLWNGTCFPFGGVPKIEAQLAEAATFPSLAAYLEHCDAEMDAAMAERRQWTECEACLGAGCDWEFATADGSRRSRECAVCEGRGEVRKAEVSR